MKIYCLKCYEYNEYSEIKPKFCGSCGNPFSNVSLSALKQSTLIPPRKAAVSPTILQKSVTDDDDDELDDTGSSVNLSNISPFKNEANFNLRSNETLGSLALDNGSKSNIVRQKGKEVSKKEFEKNWSEELNKKGSSNVGGE